MGYVETQKALQASPAGALALEMRPGTRWVLPSGETVTVWKAWVPDTDGDALKAAEKYNWYVAPDHNTEIGITTSRGVRRVKVESVADWKRAS
jgi:hypothetical protein